MSIPDTNKRFIQKYLDSLSGQPKPREAITPFVADLKLIEHIEQVERAFPRYRLVIRQMLGENDWVVVRADFEGNHQGEFAGVPASGRDVAVGAMIFYRVQDERIVEHHMQIDLAALMSQLQGASTAAVHA